MSTLDAYLAQYPLETLPQDFVPGERNGVPNLQLGGRSVSSAFNPAKEAQLLGEKLLEVPPSACVIFGTALGHLLESLAASLAKEGNKAPLLIYEPSPAWLRKLKDLRPDLGIWTNPRCQWFGPGTLDGLIATLQNAHPASISFHANQAWSKHYPSEHDELKNKVEACRFRRQVNVNTLAKFGKLWIRNLLRNLDNFAINPGIRICQGRFADMPGLLLAGGPSLDHIAPHFGPLRERMLTVAVDTSLRACLRAGLEPDFVLAVDPQYWNTRHLDFIGPWQGLMVAEPSIHPRAVRPHQERLLFASSLFPLGAMLEGAVGSKGKLGAGGSVATSAWDFLRQCGSPTIWTAGLDLSYPNGQTHFHGSFFEDGLHIGSNRTTPASLGMHRYLHDAKTQPCPAVGGGQVLSDERMDMYAHWFEQQSQIWPQVENKRFTAAHRTMEGFSPASIQEALALPTIRPAIDAELAHIRQDLTQHKDKAREEAHCTQMQDVLTGLLGSIKRVARLSREAIDLCSSKNALGHKNQARLNTIDQAVLASTDTRMVGFLMEDAIQEIHRLPAPSSLAEATERSARLYRRIAESANFYLEILATT